MAADGVDHLGAVGRVDVDAERPVAMGQVHGPPPVSGMLA
jgi:hypothetical protein